jgi:hypothetical protein
MNRNFISTFCCALLCSVLFYCVGQAQTPKLTIVNPKSPTLFDSENGVDFRASGFEVQNACSSKSKKSWFLLDSQKNVLKSSGINEAAFPLIFTFNSTQLNQKYYFRYLANDTCGGADSIEYLIEPKQKAPAKISCYQGVSVDLIPTTGETWLNGNIFFAGQSGGNQKLTFKIERGSPEGIFGENPPSTDFISIGCVGIVPIRVWAQFPNASWTYCSTLVDVQNNMGSTPKEGGNCSPVIINPPNKNGVTGTVTTSSGRKFTNGFANFYTDFGLKHQAKIEDGKYELPVSNTEKGTVRLEKNDYPLNGVSIFDVVLIRKHVLGAQAITNRYALIAADVNNSGKITTSDVVELSKMIMGAQNDFSNNPSWRFFDPFMNEEIAVKKAPVEINFTAVKIGDINGNTNAASMPRFINTHTFQVEDAHLKAGETTTLSLKGCEGFSFTMRYDADNLELINLDENSALLENSLITTAQIGSEFKATFRAKSDVTLSKSIFINSDITKAEAVVNDESYDVALEFQAKNTSFELFQNQPNPFHDATKISFILPIESRAKITISDLTGRIVKVIENDFPKGYNELIINDLQTSGILQYTLETPTNRATKKMTLH